MNGSHSPEFGSCQNEGMYASHAPDTSGAEHASSDVDPALGAPALDAPAALVPAALEPAPPKAGPGSLRALPPHAASVAQSPQNSANPADRLVISGNLTN